MKKHIFLLLLGLIFIASCVFYVPYLDEVVPPPEQEEEYYEEPPAQPTQAPELNASYFYEYLSPHGMWVYHPAYRYVWIPSDMPYGWRPYTHGHWVWTDYGWTWRSQIIWGWAPFHYGRWGWERDLGWFWTPGTVWGPGWVTWRSGDLYIGWAPLPPGVRFIAGFGIQRLRVQIPHSHWIFVDGNYFLHQNVHRYVFPYERNITIINYTVHQTNIYHRNNRIINEGIDINHIQRVTRQKVKKHSLRDTTKAELRRVDSGQLEVYRPKIRKSQTAKPKRVIEKNEAKIRISKGMTSVKKLDKQVPVIREQRIKKEHEREVKLLEDSQQKEIKSLGRKKEQDKGAAKTQKKKAKIEKEYEDKVQKLKKSHKKEKSSIKERHKKEVEKAKGKTTDKKKVKKKKKK